MDDEMGGRRHLSVVIGLLSCVGVILCRSGLGELHTDTRPRDDNQLAWCETRGPRPNTVRLPLQRI